MNARKYDSRIIFNIDEISVDQTKNSHFSLIPSSSYFSKYDDYFYNNDINNEDFLCGT
jgi:hypothetical protein